MAVRVSDSAVLSANTVLGEPDKTCMAFQVPLIFFWGLHPLFVGSETRDTWLRKLQEKQGDDIQPRALSSSVVPNVKKVTKRFIYYHYCYHCLDKKENSLKDESRTPYKITFKPAGFY